MASVVMLSAIRFAITGQINFASDTFYATLHTASYTPNPDTHDFADDLTNEVSGTGYTAGGKAITATVAAIDAANDDVEVSFGAVTWPTATITNARYGAIRKHRGGALSADELVAVIDFGGNVSSTGADFVMTPTSPLKFQLPTFP